MEEILLQRHGQRPLKFEGQKMVSAREQSPSQHCAFDIAIYERSPAGFVASLECREFVDSQELFAIHHAKIAETPEEIVVFFKNYDPTDDVVLSAALAGSPGEDDPDYLSKTAAIMQQLKRETLDTYKGLVSRTFGAQ